MRFWRAVLPNVTISLNIVMLIVIYLDLRNPMMGFLIGTPFLTLAGLCCLCSIASAIVLFVNWRKSINRKNRTPKNME